MKPVHGQGGESFDKRSLDGFPNTNIVYRIDPARQLSLSYSRRTERPDAAVLNPNDRSTDPLYRFVGNPNLRPQHTHSITLNAGWSGSKGDPVLS